MKMKKRLVLAVLCLGVITGVVACGRKEMNDQVPNDTTTEKDNMTNQKEDQKDSNYNNDVTEGNQQNSDDRDDAAPAFNRLKRQYLIYKL